MYEDDERLVSQNGFILSRNPQIYIQDEALPDLNGFDLSRNPPHPLRKEDPQYWEWNEWYSNIVDEMLEYSLTKV
jgi:hypothetical protein